MHCSTVRNNRGLAAALLGQLQHLCCGLPPSAFRAGSDGAVAGHYISPRRQRAQRPSAGQLHGKIPPAGFPARRGRAVALHAAQEHGALRRRAEQVHGLHPSTAALACAQSCHAGHGGGPSAQGLHLAEILKGLPPFATFRARADCNVPGCRRAIRQNLSHAHGDPPAGVLLARAHRAAEGNLIWVNRALHHATQHLERPIPRLRGSFSTRIDCTRICYDIWAQGILLHPSQKVDRPCPPVAAPEGHGHVVRRHVRLRPREPQRREQLHGLLPRAAPGMCCYHH
mmetsp:Transcript_79632/g.234201  ORF Transcript_79632/g.234201 Transcript_79632/m.234201 type:complete len:284 (+) Transcript_79632:478-1329(+)